MGAIVLEEIPVQRLEGTEAFFHSARSLDFTVANYWQWSASNLLDNTARGILSEFIVASALGVAGGTRSEWDSFDLSTDEQVRVEVKSAAYIQRWQQKEFSPISFDIGRKMGWDPKTATSTFVARHSDVYVFCLLSHKDQPTLNILDLNQWEFFVLATAKLDRRLGNQKSLRLNPLRKMNPIFAAYPELAAAIRLEGGAASLTH